MSHKISDLKLASEFTEEIYEDYCVALEFLNHNPDYSLLKFRLIIENTINEIAKSKKIEFDTEIIFNQIEELYDIQIINKDLRDNLHLVRKLCNSGVHKNSNSKYDKDENDFYEKSKELLIQKSHEVRQKLIVIFVDTLNILKRCLYISIKDIQLTNIKQLEFKDILFQATTELDYKKKLIAGVACETIIKEQSFDKGLVVSSAFSAHTDSLNEIAINFYDAACEISADLDKNIYIFKGDKEKAINKCAALEALYRYANSLLTTQDIEENPNSIAWKRLEAAAFRGYSPAQGLYGAYLYKLKKYEDSLKYLIEAQAKDDVMALRFLFYYYSDVDTGVFDKELAIDYLEKAIDLGCPDSLATLGMEYHKGILLTKDDEKAERYLKESIHLGSALGRNYYMIEFNDLKGFLASGLKAFADALDKAANKNKKQPIRNISQKVKPNDPCTCLSGKKYKKCCYLHGDIKVKESLQEFVRTQIS